MSARSQIPVKDEARHASRMENQKSLPHGASALGLHQDYLEENKMYPITNMFLFAAFVRGVNDFAFTPECLEAIKVESIRRTV